MTAFDKETPDLTAQHKVAPAEKAALHRRFTDRLVISAECYHPRN